MANTNNISDAFTFNNQSTPSSRLDDIAAQVCDRWNARGDLPEEFKVAIREGVETLDDIAFNFLKTLSEIENTTDIRISKKEGARLRAKPGDVFAAVDNYADDDVASKHINTLKKIEEYKMIATLDIFDRFEPLIERHGIPHNENYPTDIPSRQGDAPQWLTGSIIRSVLDNVKNTHDIIIGVRRPDDDIGYNAL